VEGARRSLSMALWFATIVTPLQIVIGDLHGLGVSSTSPPSSPRSRATGSARPTCRCASSRFPIRKRR
jgi:hypothetical protein